MEGRRQGEDVSGHSCAWERRAGPESVPQENFRISTRAVSKVQASVGT